MADKPKGGYATALIIFVMLGMIFFYMLMVYPSERQKLLRGENTTPIAPNGILLDDKNVYYVGNGEPSVNFNYTLKNIEIGYPLRQFQVKSGVNYFSANVIKPDIKVYHLNPTNDTNDFKVILKVDSINGVIDVISGSSVVKEINAPGTYSFKVPGTFSIKFSHSGWQFWTTQQAKVNVQIFEERYDKSNADVKLTIPINEIMGDHVGISINSTGNGIVKILLNGNQIYFAPLMNKTEIQSPIDEANLKTVNTLEFVSEKGTEYTINNLDFYLFTGQSPTLYKMYYINPTNESVEVGINLEILKPGELSIAVMPKGSIFFQPEPGVHNGWNYFIVNGSFMKDAHAIKVFSVDGKFKINEFKVVKVS